MQRIVGVLVVVAAAEEGPRTLRVLVVLVFRNQGEGVLFDEISWLVERVEGNAGLENASEQLAVVLVH